MYKSHYYLSIAMQLEENAIEERDPFVGYGVDYSKEEEIVDRRYFVPSSAAVSSKSSSHVGLYDSPEMLKSDYIASVNASIRRPGSDVTEMRVGLSKLQAVAEQSIKNDMDKAQQDLSNQVDSKPQEVNNAPTMDSNRS